MRTPIALLLLSGFACLPFGARPLAAQEDVDDIPSAEITLDEDGDGRQRYFRIGPKTDDVPDDGYGLLVILPGGDGGDGFHAFCKRIYKHACDDDFVAVQPVAVKWSDDQRIVWPTRENDVEGMRFSTEEFVEAVIADAAEWKRIDRERVLVLAWSSSGPAAYALSLTRGSTPGGYLIAMSVFKPDTLPSLRRARGKRYFLYHSPDDRVCPYRMAEDAVKQLKRRGAKVKLVDYDGGHGWRGPLYRDLGAGLTWLDR